MAERHLDSVAAAEADLHAFPWRRKQFADSLAAGHEAWIACVSGELAGYAVVMQALDEVELLDIAVLKAWQRQGLGCALLDFLLGRARQAGARTMFLEVRASNQAGLALYRGTGFSEVGRRRGYYPAHQGREDAVVMRRELS
ncbi:MAG: ribosomal protein S18-alanine N-acetyltransferase [Rhodocyclaceae bacterium]|nr:ribosomal protein S18-alanine N-acetyltransferase [Rhodocyclaceae bacterium]